MTDEPNVERHEDPETDNAYFAIRAAWHAERADIAEDPTTRRLHERFAQIYADRARG